MFGNQAVVAGTPFVRRNVPAGTAVGVVPGGGGSMLVQYRISEGGPLRNWTPGSVAANADDVMRMPVAELIFTATTTDGLAEWYEPSTGYGL